MIMTSSRISSRPASNRLDRFSPNGQTSGWQISSPLVWVWLLLQGELLGFDQAQAAWALTPGTANRPWWLLSSSTSSYLPSGSRCRHRIPHSRTRATPLLNLATLPLQEEDPDLVLDRNPPSPLQSTTAAWSTTSSSWSTEAVDQHQRQDLIEIGRQRLQRYFAFPLDDWQLQAGGAICQGYHVIVSAPTGAGKTVVGEMALLHAFYHAPSDDDDEDPSFSTLYSGIYTTPLKALSNQKYTELCQLFGKAHTGLSTGDVSINKGARITVMTTEVYRNIAWRSSSSSSGALSTGSGFSSGMGPGMRGNPTTLPSILANPMNTNELMTNKVVVLDELHYMGYPGRGGVWEESIITTPSHTQIIGLSATLANAPALAAWMQSVTDRPTLLVEVPGQQRPVPLRYLFATKEGLWPLFRDPDAGPGAPKGLLGYRGDGIPARGGDAANNTKKKSKGFAQDEDATSGDDSKLPRGLQVNPALKAAAEKRMEKVQRAMQRQKVRHHLSEGGDVDPENGDTRIRRQAYQPPRRMSSREERKERERLLRNEMRRAVPSLPALLKRLEQRQLLPAIFFIFSRAGCDDAARAVHQVLKGPRDPNRRLADELDNFEAFNSKNAKPKKQQQQPDQRQQQLQQRTKKPRQRASRKGNLVEDDQGRAFRPGSNYVSEEVLTSLFEGSGPLLDEGEFDETSPLSPNNWDYYAKAGLLEYDEVRQVASKVSSFNAENPEIAFEDELIEQYMFGVGSHHAGMLPAHKSFVEVLYRQELMKAVFSTETLAAGINMPARTTVICAMAKRGDGSSMNLLDTSNMLQMAGRAGRRGMDTDGTCVIVATPFESHDDAAKILTDPIKPITSQFSPSYSLAVNLIARGEGRLDVARQLVSKSFAMWEKRQVENNIATAVENHGEGVSQILLASAQERFVSLLVIAMQNLVDQRSSRYDIARIVSLLEVLNDRDALKKSSKEFIGAAQMFELEQTTLGYLEQELNRMQSATLDSTERELVDEMISEDQRGLVEQIEIQQTRKKASEREVHKHPFTAIAKIANDIMADNTDDGRQLVDVLKAARGDQALPPHVSPEELSSFAKSAIVTRKKARKLANANPGLNTEELLMQAGKMEIVRDSSWDEMLSITKTLVAYGCLTMSPLSSEHNIEDATFTITPAGENIGMLGFENPLWCLAAMGGAWDVGGASRTLDQFRDAMKSFDEVEDANEIDAGGVGSVPKSQREAEELLSMLKSMSSSELAGYVSCLIAENSRTAASIVELFQGLTPLQQEVIQKALVVNERLVEVQRLYSVDEGTRTCSIDMSTCEVVTAWASGCTWSEALQISGLSPGDLARTLSRVLDAVRQFGNLPFTPVRKGDLLGISQIEKVSKGIHPEVRRLCREAAQSINRYPVKDPLSFEATEDDEDEADSGEVAEETASVNGS